MNIDKKGKIASKRINKAKKDKSLNADKEGGYKPPKNWKHVYLRSEKLRRAKQLGFQYPRLSQQQLLDQEDKLGDDEED